MATKVRSYTPEEAQRLFEKTAQTTPQLIGVIRQHPELARDYYQGLIQSAQPETLATLVEHGLKIAFYVASENHWDTVYPELISIVRWGRAVFPEDWVRDNCGAMFYHVYDGNMTPLRELVLDVEAWEPAKDAALCTLAQLYLDGLLSKETLSDMISQSMRAHVQADKRVFMLPDVAAALGLEELAEGMERLLGYDEAVIAELYNMYTNPFELVHAYAYVTLEQGLGQYKARSAPEAVRRQCRDTQAERIESFLIQYGEL